MCCKGRKCFGEHSLLLVRYQGAVKLMTITQILGLNVLERIEVPNDVGIWKRIQKLEWTGDETVYELSEWPLYVSAHHDVRTICDRERVMGKTDTKQNVYELTVEDTDTILVGTYYAEVTRGEKGCEKQELLSNRS